MPMLIGRPAGPALAPFGRMRRFVALLALAASGCAPSSMPRPVSHQATIVGAETIAEFRAWPLGVKAGYVTGFQSLARMVGMRCERAATVGETIAALDTRPFAPDMTMQRAMFILMIE